MREVGGGESGGQTGVKDIRRQGFTIWRRSFHIGGSDVLCPRGVFFHG
jgi:hypothetical protein